MTIRNILLFTIVAALLFLNFQCNDCDSELHDSSSYSAEISPLNSEYKVNDTITVSVNFSSDILLERTEEIYDNSNQYMDFTFQVMRVNSDNQRIVEGIEDFVISSDSSMISEASYYSHLLSKGILTECDDMSCGYKINIIPLESGIYGFGLLRVQFGDGICTFLSMDINDFGLDYNNFEICQKINTDQLRIKDSYYSDPLSIRRYYFFEVTE